MPTSLKPVQPFFDDAPTQVAQPSIVSLAENTGLDAPTKITILNPSKSLSRDVTPVPPTPQFRLAQSPGPLSRSRRPTPAPGSHSRQATPAPVPVPVPAPAARSSRSSPYPKAVTFRRASPASSASEQAHDTSDSFSDASSENESTLSTLPDDDCKIPKPQGEPGRPGRGGYTLETALNWNHKAYVKLKTITYRLIDEHLDTTKCASVQSPPLLEIVRDKAMAAFPDLENYSNVWPVNDLIMMRLKYTSSRARRRETEMAAGKSKCTRSSK